MSIAVKSGLPSVGSTEGAVISADEVSVSEDSSAAASVGEDLPRGKSAYEIAKENGFDGTEAEWLASLKGATGAKGADGKDGEDGKTPYVGGNGNWFVGNDDTGKPSRGEKGDTGAAGKDGVTPTFVVESVETAEAGEDARAYLTGDSPNFGFNFVIPKGDKGDTGATGAKGADGKDGAAGKDGADGHTPVITASKANGVTTVKADGEAIATINDGAKGADGSPGAKGDKGDTGATPNLSIGTVTTLEAGQDAAANISGTSTNPVLNLSIPKGAKGDPGEGGTGAWYVTVHQDDDGNVTANKTLAEIKAAYQAGYAVYCKYFDVDLSGIVPLINMSGSWALFFGTVSLFAAPFGIGICCVDSAWQVRFVPAYTDIVTELSASNTDKQVPSAKLLYTLAQSIKIPAVVTSVSSSSTDAQVPSAKCLYDLVGNVTAQVDAMRGSGVSESIAEAITANNEMIAEQSGELDEILAAIEAKT